jgi:teichuronic acid biosynthesis glycosyltransferase TuaC
MRILFVCRANKAGKPNIIVYNQANTICDEVYNVQFYLITGNGIPAYLKHVFKLRRFVKTHQFDIIHAHYSFSGYVAALAGCNPLVVSLMGSDAYMSSFWRRISAFFYRYCWTHTIVKSEEMKQILNFTKAEIVPNGVNLSLFQVKDKSVARKHLGLPLDKLVVLFIADISRPEKNYSLAKESVALLNRDDVILLPVFNTPHDKIPDYLSAGDVLFVTSKWEGSVNVVKEALACNLPIVSTDVGDVRRNIEDVQGCFIGDSTPQDLSKKLTIALNIKNRTNGRDELIKLKLDSNTVARRLIDIYESLIIS